MPQTKTKIHTIKTGRNFWKGKIYPQNFLTTKGEF